MSHNIFIANVPNRTERSSHVISEFSDKGFDYDIVSGIPHKFGCVSLWLTLQHIIREKVNWNDDCFILCGDDHQFTEYYNFALLLQYIKEAQDLNADILLGGVSGFKTGVQISNNLFWIEKFSGLQFTVIFKKNYQKILDVIDFGEYDVADYKISDLTDKKFVIYPFISTQKEFGYSDVTAKNNQKGRVEKLFEETSERFELLKKVRSFYLPEFK